jgi:hypothetical protein
MRTSWDFAKFVAHQGLPPKVPSTHRFGPGIAIVPIDMCPVMRVDLATFGDHGAETLGTYATALREGQVAVTLYFGVSKHFRRSRLPCKRPNSDNISMCARFTLRRRLHLVMRELAAMLPVGLFDFDPEPCGTAPSLYSCFRGEPLGRPGYVGAVLRRGVRLAPAARAEAISGNSGFCCVGFAGPRTTDIHEAAFAPIPEPDSLIPCLDFCGCHPPTAFANARLQTVSASADRRRQRPITISWRRSMYRVHLALAVILCVCPLAHSQVVTITKIADMATVPPGGTTPFTGFGSPVIDGSTVAFAGAVGNSTAVYASSGGVISTIVPPDPSTAYAGGIGYKNGTLVYQATTSGETAIFSLSGGTVTRFVDTTTPIPGGTGAFGSFGGTSLSNGRLVFTGQSGDAQQGGIYVSSGGTPPSLSIVADQNTPIPGAGGANFTSYYFGNAAISGNSVIFRGSVYTSTLGNFAGIYERVGQGPITTIANGNTPLPGGTGNFPTDFGDTVAVSGSNVAFVSDQKGVYARINGVMTKVVDGSTPSPNGTGNFDAGDFDLGSVIAMNGSDVAFVGYTATSVGVYLYDGSALHTLIDNTNPVFDGQPLNPYTPFSISTNAIDGNSVVFTANFGNAGDPPYPTGSGIFVATFSAVPEPSTLALAGFGALALVGRWLRVRPGRGVSG